MEVKGQRRPSKQSEAQGRRIQDKHKRFAFSFFELITVIYGLTDYPN